MMTGRKLQVMRKKSFRGVGIERIGCCGGALGRHRKASTRDGGKAKTAATFRGVYSGPGSGLDLGGCRLASGGYLASTYMKHLALLRVGHATAAAAARLGKLGPWFTASTDHRNEMLLRESISLFTSKNPEALANTLPLLCRPDKSELEWQLPAL